MEGKEGKGKGAKRQRKGFEKPQRWESFTEKERNKLHFIIKLVNRYFQS